MISAHEDYITVLKDAVRCPRQPATQDCTPDLHKFSPSHRAAKRLLVRGCHRNTHCKDTQSPPGLRLQRQEAEENKQERADSGGKGNLSVNQRKYKHTHVGTQISQQCPECIKKGHR